MHTREDYHDDENAPKRISVIEDKADAISEIKN